MNTINEIALHIRNLFRPIVEEVIAEHEATKVENEHSSRYDTSTRTIALRTVEVMEQLVETVNKLQEQNRLLNEKLTILTEAHNDLTDSVDAMKTNIDNLSHNLDRLDDEVNRIDAEKLDDDTVGEPIDAWADNNMVDRVREMLTDGTIELKITAE